MNSDETTEDDTESDDHLWRHTLVADEESADELVFADVEGVERARQFLVDTDFGTETVYVEQTELGECYARELCWVRWTESAIETSYRDGYRDADVACDTGEDDVVALLVRLPVALDSDQIRRFSSNSGSGGCRTHTSEEETA
ncbi:hypothetical protein [Halorussus ruber]|uniref:hypothetical protein n=1 Tax=Halorussus ruber TaxID=1126238 RepID=UPI001092DFFF|nr:hypothetical protein [Halorussus ruber]